MFYLIDKPAGISSHAAIRAFAQSVGAAKVGHAGTLDPFGTGLLLVATDADTPLLRFADRATKTYAVRMLLGAYANTDDITGELTPTSQPIPPMPTVHQAILNLTNITTQVPPAYSAKQVAGHRAYALARQGQAVKLAPISARVTKVTDIVSHATNEWSFVCEVSRGTYVRALVRELGAQLGCGAYTAALRRTAIGELTLGLVGQPLRASTVVTLPPLQLAAYPQLLHGVPSQVTAAEGYYALVDAQNEVVGVARVSATGWMRVERLLGAKLAV